MSVEAPRRDLLVEKLEEYEQTIRRLTAQYATLKTQMQRLLEGGTPKTRYPADAERAPSGRVIHACAGCHRVVEIRARGLCATCYSRLWRRLSLQSPRDR